MFQKLLLVYIIIFKIFHVSASLPSNPTVELISFQSSEGIKLLERSKFKQDFFFLSNRFESQENKAFCGPATLSIVLNALFVTPGAEPVKEIPSAQHYLSSDDKKVLGDNDPSFQKFTQTNIFEKSPSKSREVALGKKVDGKDDSGFQLEQLAAAFRAQGLIVEKWVVSTEAPSKENIKLLKKILTEEGNFIVVNYTRKILGQPGGGHISPVGAYDAKSKRFLIMDVNTNKAPWVWIKEDDLWRAMNTFDTVENRGLLIISKSKS